MVKVFHSSRHLPEKHQEQEHSNIYNKWNAMKTCAKCKQEKEITQFTPDKSLKSGYRSYCKECQRIKTKENGRKRYKNGKRKEYNKQNAETISIKYSEWRVKNKISISEKAKLRYQNDLEYKLLHILRVRIQKAVRLNCKKTSSKDLLGCSIEFYKKYLESKFNQEMTWDNYGRKKGCWSIDHIIPCSSFNLFDLEQLKQCFHYTNTQPMWWLDNLKKNNKIT